LAARPARPEQWPELDRRSVPKPDALPELVDAGIVVAKSVNIFTHSDAPLTNETVADVMARWNFERRNYPGWVVAPENKRSELLTKTESWIEPLLKFAIHWSAVDRVPFVP